MRHLLTMSAIGACGLVMAGCATTDNYASACERDYAENRNRAMAAGTALGAAIGAAVAGEDDREADAARAAAVRAVVIRRIGSSRSDRSNRPRRGPFPHQRRPSSRQ